LSIIGESIVVTEDGLDAKSARELMDGVPRLNRFRTVDELEEASRELADKYPGVVEWRRIGESSEGKPITALVIGEGERSAFLYGFTHPNEPIGSATIEYLESRLAASSELRKKIGYRFILAKAIDVDGARLNEGWFCGPFDILTYSQNYYRPPPNEQAEWTFPINYKTLHWTTPNPETRAIKAIVDEFKPEFTYILHNADFCGVYYYLSHDLPSAYAELKNIPNSEGLPLHRGEPPDQLYQKSLDEGIYHDYGISDEYEFLAKIFDCDPAKRIGCGTDSYEYIREKYDGFCLTCEVPHFYDERIMDTTPTCNKRRDLLFESLRAEAETHELVRHALDECDELSNMNPRIYRATRYFVDHWAEDEQIMRTHSRDEAFDRQATVAETFDFKVLKKFSQMPILGMTERLLKEAEERTRSQRLRTLHETVHSRLIQLNGDVIRESKPKAIPIDTLVRIQLQSALVCLRHLSSRMH
jgi:hypothetical protein